MAYFWQQGPVRVLFGNKKAHSEKFETCAKARPYLNQALDNSFSQLEHTKPLFNKHGILAFENLYTYHTFIETFKILKLHTPISLYNLYTKSHRKEITLIVPSCSTGDFVKRFTTLWNTIAPKMKLVDYSYKISLAKSNVKTALNSVQNTGDANFWTENDFNAQKISSNDLQPQKFLSTRDPKPQIF